MDKRSLTERDICTKFTRSDNGRDARDTFLSPLKTCDKLGIRFRDCLGDRLAVAGAKAVPRLPLIVAQPVHPA